MKIHCLLRIRVKVFINCSRYESDSLMFHFVDFKSILYLLSYCPCLIVLVLATQQLHQAKPEQEHIVVFTNIQKNSLQMKVTLLMNTICQSFTGLWFFIYAWNNSLQMKVTLYNEAIYQDTICQSYTCL